MADDKAKRGGSDGRLIALGEAYEVRYWSRKFKVTPLKLKAAVKAVGRSAKTVEAYLKLQKRSTNDRALIALTQPYEVSYWSKKFKVTPARLRAAVGEVGRSAKKVGAFLAAKKTVRKKTAGKKKTTAKKVRVKKAKAKKAKKSASKRAR
ncbi:DUF3606 domain-containing protein [Nitrobacter sp. TKz-YC02]|uniref:DUF3606 domain-containing protein n=1 Tax=Nitrobacter sp. TKz-YC02 TaxID=3398704 RepID=UPI003CFA977B